MAKIGMERFFYRADLAWHIHQQELEIYFTQGLSLVDMVLLIRALCGATSYRPPAGDAFATTLATLLTTFLTVSLLGSNLNTTRLSLAFYLRAMAAITLTTGSRRCDR